MAEVSVRRADTGDVPEVARIQLATWRAAYGHIVPKRVLDGVTEQQARDRWAAAVTAPPSPRHRVLVAQEQGWIVGFAAFGPTDEQDVDGSRTAEITATVVEPRWGRRGHGSRMLAAAAEALRADGFGAAIVWILERDPASKRFYESAGFAADGTARALDMDGTLVHEIRLRTSLDPDPDDDPAPDDGGPL